MSKHSIGIDIGGTNIKLGIVDPKGNIIARSRINTIDVARNKNVMLDAIADSVLGLLITCGLFKDDIDGIGIGVPGLVNYKTGVVISLTNIFGWKNVPLSGMMQKRLDFPVYVDNDVNVITLAEWRAGAAKGFNNLLCITLGTGVGGGLILNDQLYRGEGFAAGEIGHVPLNEKGPKCNCGGEACFERYVGNGVLLQKAIKLFKRKDIRLEEVGKLAAGGDKKALDFWEETGHYVGLGLAGFVNVFNPGLIVIGGGVSNNFRFMKKSIVKTIRERSMPTHSRMVSVVRATLGDDAGILGGQALIRESQIVR